jgi:hypothetical protein
MQALCSISWAHCNQYRPIFDWVGGTLRRNMDTPPILQLAFQYSILVPQDEDAIPVSSNGKSSQKALSNSRYDKPKCLVFGKLLEKLLIPCSVMYYPALLFFHQAWGNVNQLLALLVIIAQMCKVWWFLLWIYLFVIGIKKWRKSFQLYAHGKDGH